MRHSSGNDRTSLWVWVFFSGLILAILVAVAIELRRSPTKAPAVAAASDSGYTNTNTTNNTGTTKSGEQQASAPNSATTAPSAQPSNVSDECGQLFKDESMHHLVGQLDAFNPRLPQSASNETERAPLNDTLKSIITSKRVAMAKIKDQPGNSDCYYYIGMLFFFDLKRATSVGTFADRNEAFDLRYRPKGSPTMFRGYAEIMRYFLEEYLHRDPTGVHVDAAHDMLRRFPS